MIVAIELSAEDLLSRPPQYDRAGASLRPWQEDDPLLQSDLLPAEGPKLAQPHQGERRERRDLLDGRRQAVEDLQLLLRAQPPHARFVLGKEGSAGELEIR